MSETDIIKRHQAIEAKKQSIAKKQASQIEGSFKNLIQSRQGKADEIIKKIADVAVAAGVADELNLGAEKTARYIVNMPEETKDAIAKGLIKLDKGKDGQLYAQLRDADNHYGKKLSISEELANQGVDPLEAMNALQLKAIQDQLAEMAATIDAISHDVESVLQGQQNDRLGLFYAGKALLLEAQNVQEPVFKQLLSTQALSTLSEASAQLTLQIQSDMQYLTDGQYKSRRGKQAEQIKAHMESINKSFQVIHEATLLKASIYYEAEELSAMLATVSDYGRFLAENVVPNALKLAEYDCEDNLLKGGKWDARSKSLAGVEELKSRLAAGTSFYLDAPKMEDNDGER